MSFEIPFLKFTAHAGFPSPAEDFLEPSLNLNKYLIQNSAATFCVKVKGDSMAGSRITTGDILIVDRSLKAENGKVVIAVIDGELTVKKYKEEGKKITLKAENESYEDIEFQVEDIEEKDD